MDIEGTDVTINSVKLKWDPPENDGGSEVLHYIVEKRPIDKKTWAMVNSNVDREKASLKVGNLSPGTEYYFRVTAVNEYGPGVPKISAQSYLASNPVSKYYPEPRNHSPQFPCNIRTEY